MFFVFIFGKLALSLSFIILAVFIILHRSSWSYYANLDKNVVSLESINEVEIIKFCLKFILRKCKTLYFLEKKIHWEDKYSFYFYLYVDQRSCTFKWNSKQLSIKYLTLILSSIYYSFSSLIYTEFNFFVS